MFPVMSACPLTHANDIFASDVVVMCNMFLCMLTANRLVVLGLLISVSADCESDRMMYLLLSAFDLIQSMALRMASISA